jgi:hypothetical protein
MEEEQVMRPGILKIVEGVPFFRDSIFSFMYGRVATRPDIKENMHGRDPPVHKGKFK